MRNELLDIKQTLKTNLLKTIDLEENIKKKRLEIIRMAKENEERTDLLLKIKEKISEIEKTPSKASIKLHEIKLWFEDYFSSSDDTFALQLEEEHQIYINKLKLQFPQLTGYDLRLCLYIKIGMHAKEIAEVMHVLPSSIYISRSRLRKKLNLNLEDDLLDFLFNF